MGSTNFDHGTRAYWAGDYAAAATALADAAQERPDNADAWLYLSDSLQRLGRDEEALVAARTGAELAPDTLSSWTTLSLVLGKLGRLEESLEAAERATVVAPEDALAWHYLGGALARLGRMKEAYSAHTRAIGCDPMRADVVIARGQLLMEMDLPGAALADFAKGTELGSEDPGAWHNLGELLRPERPAEALEAFDRAVALDPQSASSWTSRGITLGLLRRVDEALASLERALALDPDDAGAWFAKAAALAQLERDEEALAALERAMALDSDQFGASEDAWHLRGRCLMRLGRPDEAGTAFGTSLRLRQEARRRRRRGLFGRRREPEEP